MAERLRSLSTFYAACVQGGADCTKFEAKTQEIQWNADKLKRFAEGLNSPELMSTFHKFGGSLQAINTMHKECTANTNCATQTKFERAVNATNDKYLDILKEVGKTEGNAAETAQDSNGVALDLLSDAVRTKVQLRAGSRGKWGHWHWPHWHWPHSHHHHCPHHHGRYKCHPTCYMDGYWMGIHIGNGRCCCTKRGAQAPWYQPCLRMISFMSQTPL